MVITHADVDEIEKAFNERREAKQILRNAKEWFDLHRPQWGPGTLPHWVTDADKFFRETQE